MGIIMAKQIKKIFIASRFEEFKEIREKLRDELSYYGMDFIDLNDNKAVSHPPLERSLQNVRESDIVILLIGDTYGDLLPEKLKSYTHLEYDEAIKYEKHIYIFYVESKARPTTMQKERERAIAWREDLEKTHTLSFHDKRKNIEDIVHDIIKSVYSEEKKVWLDNDTGLMWQVQIRNSRCSFYDTLKCRNTLNQSEYGGFNDWRIPTIDELKTINTEESYKNTYGYDKETFIKKPLVYSMTMEFGRFWSSTPNPTNNNLAYGINFNRKRSNSKSKHGEKEKYATRYIRCVRLWNYETVNSELNNMLESPDIKIENLENFLNKYSDSQYDEYKKIALAKLEELRKKKEKELNSLTLIEQKMLTIKEDNPHISESMSLMSAIEKGEFDSEKLDALLKLKELMKKEDNWKEESGARNPNRDKNYQKTLKIIGLINGCK